VSAAFVQISRQNRKKAQANLSKLKLYSTKIDGVWGPNTATALFLYNKHFLNGADLRKSGNAIELFKKLLNHDNYSSPKLVLKPKPTQQPTDKPKKKRNLTKEFGLSLYGSFLHSEKVPNALFFFADIEENDSFEFRKALRNHDADLIILSSPGGSVLEGLSIAGIINDKSLNIYVPKNSTAGKGNCASACSFMYFAGKNRTVNGALGVHQFYSSDGTKKAEVGNTQKSAQFTVSEIIGFLNEFETPPWVFERMFQQSEMYYFKESELVQLETETTELQQATYGRAEAFISELRMAFDEMED
tara:strand:- start:21064 stop:21969 length:906 start_codon:yes stop_codon:yes gene_type:complete